MPVFFVVIALILFYWLYLTLIQLASGPKRDLKSPLPVPPRALTGNGAWPILGHTILFHKYGADTAYLFPPEWREWRCWPWSRKLGNTYSIFVWGQWNIVVKGQETVEKVISEGDLTEGWPYKSPAITLLGKTCPALLDDEEASCLRSMISGPLSHASVVKHAPQFAQLAEKCVEGIISGRFNKERHTLRHDDTRDTDDEVMNTSDSGSSDNGDKACKVRLDALRSYTLKLMHGPVLNLDRDNRDVMSTTTSIRKMSLGGSISEDREFMSSMNASMNASGLKMSAGNGPHDVEAGVRFEGTTNDTEVEDEDDLPSQEMLLLWMHWLKKGICDMKFTYGSDWMQLWRLNWYGRALNARKKLESMLSAHVAERSKHVPVHHEKGRATRDPLASAIPLWRLTESYFFRSEHPIMGFRKSKIAASNRNRTRSENDVVPEMASNEYTNIKAQGRTRNRAQSEPDFIDVEATKPVNKAGRKVIHSVLDQILREADYEGRGITRVATTEITLLLWMMMDAGQAWTSMALHLLTKHENAYDEVRDEIDRLETKFKNRLFTSFVLGKMEKLDNLIFEAIRFCPAFMGGLKMVNQTIELDDVQIPKNSNVLLSNPQDEDTFTIDYDPPKKPEELGMVYPSINLYGFLPLQGLEIPIMVLQTKIFLIALLQKHEPVLKSTRRNFVRRMTEKLSKSFKQIRSPSKDSLAFSIQRSRSADDVNTLADEEIGTIPTSVLKTPTRPTRRAEKSMNTPDPPRTPNIPRVEGRHLEIRHEERLFTKVPFPEPRRAIQIRARAEKQLFPPPPSTPENLPKPDFASRCFTR